MSTRKIYSFCNETNNQMHFVDSKITDRVYRIKILRALYVNTKIRVRPINSVFECKLKDKDDWKTFRIPFGDYTPFGLAYILNEFINSEFYGIAETKFSYHKKRFILESKTNFIVNNFNFFTITRTLGFSPSQQIHINNNCKFVAAENKFSNLYCFQKKEKKTIVDEVELKQRQSWQSHYYYNEINEDINIRINSADVVRSSNPLQTEACSAKISLGAPGLPSKRLLTTERNVNWKNNHGRIDISFETSAKEEFIRGEVDILFFMK